MKKSNDNIRDHMHRLLQQMSAGIYERDYALAMALLTAVAGESFFLLGLPGVGKSLIARRLKLAFRNAQSFEYLMSRFSTPDEIFGPVSIAKLKDDGIYERLVDGYLPTADVVFLDEIWKAGPSIQNALLTVLNEKIFHNGDKDIALPLKGIIAASNELPAVNEGLEALWDRFLIRMVVAPLDSRDAFEAMITATADTDVCVDESLKISAEEYASLRQKADTVAVTPQILETIADIRQYLRTPGEGEERKEPVYISDRRWKKIVRLLRTAAMLDGRKEVAVTDCFIIGNAVWNESEQRTAALEAVDRIVINRMLADYEDEYSLLSDKRLEIHRILLSQMRKSDIPVSRFRIVDDKYYNIVGYGENDTLIDRREYDALVPFVAQRAVLSESVDVQIVTPEKSVVYPSNMTVSITKTNGGLQINGTVYPLKTADDEMLRKYFPEIYGWLADLGERLDALRSRLKEYARTNLSDSNRSLFVSDLQIKKCRAAVSRLQLRIRKLKNILYTINHNEQ